MIRRGFRTLRRNLSLTLTIIALSGVAVGLSTVIFSILHAVVIDVAPYPRAERLFDVRCAAQGAAGACSLRVAQALQEEWSAVDELGFSTYGPTYMRYGNSEPLLVPTRLVSSGLLSAIGMRPQIGRWFLESDNREARDRIVLSDRSWERLTGRDPQVLGTSVIVGGKPYEVVGVMPPAFSFPESRVAAWVLFPLTAGRMEQLDAFRWNIILRARPAVNVQRLNSDAALIATRLAHGRRSSDNTTIEVRPLREALLGPDAVVIWFLFAGTICLLIVVTANIVNLLVVLRLKSYDGVLIRLALGANRRQLMGEHLVQYLLLAVPASGLAVGVAVVALRAFQQMGAFSVSRAELAAIDLSASIYSGASCMLLIATAGLCASALMKRATASTLLGDAKAQLNRAAARSTATVIQSVAVGVQVCLALVLTGAAMSAIGLLHYVWTLPLGFDPQGLYAIASEAILPAPQGDLRSAVQRVERLRQELHSVPGVEDVAIASFAPFAGATTVPSLELLKPSGERIAGPATRVQIVSENYFDVLRISLLSGRRFTGADREGGPCVAIANVALAGAFGAVDDALKASVRAGEPTALGDCAIIGVAEDARDVRVKSPTTPVVYFSTRQVPSGVSTILIRSRDRADIAPQLKKTLTDYAKIRVDSSLSSIDYVASRGTVRDRLLTYVMLCFGLCGFGVTVLGVMALVRSRILAGTQEIGIRIALGQPAITACARTIADSMWAAGAGICAGVYVSYGSSRLYGSWNPDLHPIGTGGYVLLCLGWIGVIALATAPPILALRRRSIRELIQWQH